MREVGDEIVEAYKRLRNNIRGVDQFPYKAGRPRFIGHRGTMRRFLRFGKPENDAERVTFQDFLSAYNLEYVIHPYDPNYE